jgi:hypothetical protein
MECRAVQQSCLGHLGAKAVLDQLARSLETDKAGGIRVILRRAAVAAAVGPS